jgi:hypothetical protein
MFNTKDMVKWLNRDVCRVEKFIADKYSTCHGQLKKKELYPENTVVQKYRRFYGTLRKTSHLVQLRPKSEVKVLIEERYVRKNNYRQKCTKLKVTYLVCTSFLVAHHL